MYMWIAILLIALLIIWYRGSEGLAVRYHPGQLAYATFEDAHKHRVRSTVKDASGLALSDYALENTLLNKNSV